MAGAMKPTSEKILDAAERLLLDRGYEAVSVRDIALRARVNKALVFYHFGNKDKLFDAVLDRYYAAHGEALAGALGDGGPLAARMHRAVDAYFEFIDAHRAFPRLVQLELGRGGGKIAKIRRSLAALYDVLSRALGDAVPDDGPLSAKQFFLSFSGMVVNYYTYAPALATLWGGDPLGPAARDERRRHLHWMVDAVLERLPRRP